MEEIVLLNASLALAEKLLPIVAHQFGVGLVTTQQQAELRKKYLALRVRGDAAFSGPEWEVEGSAERGVQSAE